MTTRLVSRARKIDPMAYALPDTIAADLLHGAIYELEGVRIGLRKITKAWFNFASGHYVLWTDTPILYWGDTPSGSWHCQVRSRP